MFHCRVPRLLRLISVSLSIVNSASSQGKKNRAEVESLSLRNPNQKEMRRFSGGRGIGRTVGRAGGVQEVVTNRPILNKPSSPNSASLLSNLSISSSIPVLAASSSSNVTSFFPPGHSSCSFFYDDSDEWEWETVDGDDEDKEKDIGDENGNGFFDRLVFGQVPSMDEVEDVVTALKHVSSAGSQLDWIEPAMHVCNPRMLRSHGHERVYDAFHLLQTEPTVQRMVIALSSDKAVWNAVLSNEVVQEIKEAFYAAENDGLLKASGNPDPNKNILKLFLEKSKTKVMELIEKISDLLSSIFQSQETQKDTTTGTKNFEGNLRYSFMLSTVVLLIVILNRVYKA